MNPIGEFHEFGATNTFLDCWRVTDPFFSRAKELIYLPYLIAYRASFFSAFNALNFGKNPRWSEVKRLKTDPSGANILIASFHVKYGNIC